MTSPICTVNSASTLDGYNTVPGGSITIALVDKTGVSSWSISCISTDDQQTTAAINALLTINQTLKTATFTVPSTARGCTLIFQSKVNNGLDSNNNVNSSYTTTFGIYAIGTGGLRLIAANETIEGNSVFGWTASFNSVLALGGTTPNATGSIAGIVKLAGDLSNTYDAPKVVKLQGYAVDSAPPDDGYSLVWSSSANKWKSTEISASVSDADASTKGVLKLAGDLAGSGSSADLPRVGKINGASVPASGSLTPGHLLNVSGTSALAYGYLVNANVDAAAAIDGSKINPDFTGQDLIADLVTCEGVQITTDTINNIIGGGITVTPTVVSTATFTIDGSGKKHYMLLVDTSSIAIQLNLPSPAIGRYFIIKDYKGNANTRNITIHRAGTEKIERVAADYVLSTNGQCIHLVSDGTDWHKVN